MADYHQPCTDHVELRVKTERELAVIGAAMQNHVNALKESSSTMTECVIKLEDAVELMTAGRVALARQDERLKAGNDRYRLHGRALVSIAIMLAASMLTMAAIHGQEALKHMRVVF